MLHQSNESGVGPRGLGDLTTLQKSLRRLHVDVRELGAPLDGVAFGVNNLALALGDTGIRVD